MIDDPTVVPPAIEQAEGRVRIRVQTARDLADRLDALDGTERLADAVSTIKAVVRELITLLVLP